MAPPFPSLTKTYHHKSYPAISPSRPELSTAGKTVLITGGGAGIGLAIAHGFAAAGSTQIALTGRTRRTLDAAKAALEAAHPGLRVAVFAADVADAAASAAAFAAAQQAFGALDVLVHNAAYLGDAGAVADCDLDDWFASFEVNVKGTAIAAREFLRVAAPAPVIVTLATAAAHLPPMPTFSAYTVSKLASLQVMAAVGAENPHVRVMAMHPGVIETDMAKRAAEQGLALPYDESDLPAHFAVWLVSAEAEFLKGKLAWANWDVDELRARKEELLLTVGLLGWP